MVHAFDRNFQSFKYLFYRLVKSFNGLDNFMRIANVVWFPLTATLLASTHHIRWTPKYSANISYEIGTILCMHIKYTKSESQTTSNKCYILRLWADSFTENCSRASILGSDGCFVVIFFSTKDVFGSVSSTEQTCKLVNWENAGELY